MKDINVEEVVAFLIRREPVRSDYANYFAELEGMPVKRHFTSFDSMNALDDWSSIEYEGANVWTMRQ